MQKQNMEKNLLKFSLIKEYPGSPKLGTIAYPWDYIKEPNSNWTYNGNKEGFIKIDITKYPEYWEKIEELCVPIGTWFVDSSDYTISTIDSVENNLVKILWKDSNIPCCAYTVSAVNELFSKGVFKEFKKEPLFVTEDGVNIFEGDEYYTVFSCFDKNEDVYPFKINGPFKARIIRYLGVPKYFSTKEAAQKYVNENKPKYSEKELREFEILAFNRGLTFTNLLK
jgi:hypothetical protein